MDKREKALLVSKAEELGWHVEIDQNNWKFQKSSQNGETFQVDIIGENVVSELRKHYCGLTTEDHVTIRIESKKIGICDTKSLAALIDDAFRKMVDTLYNALSDAEDAYYEEATDATNCELGIYDCSTCSINGNCIRQDETGADE